MEEGFDAVAVEADWPDAYRLIALYPETRTIRTLTRPCPIFNGFPTWMWRNTEVQAFVKWLHDYNEGRKEDDQEESGGPDGVCWLLRP